MRRNTLLLILLLGVTLFADQVQTTAQVPAADHPLGRRDEMRDPAQESREEMLREMEVKRAENSHKQNVERAKESAQLSTELRDAYAQHKTLGEADVKKLARMEKLARQLRSESGGSDDDEPLKEPPPDMTATLARIVDITAGLRKTVEKTPRQVISAGIISQTNELIELVRLARTFIR